MSEYKNNHWSGSKAGGRGAGNEAESENHRNRFEREAENLPLPIRSHALPMASVLLQLMQPAANEFVFLLYYTAC